MSIKKIPILVILILGAAHCFAGEKISLKMLPETKRRKYSEIKVKTGGIEIGKKSRHYSILLSTPAGKFSFVGYFPPYPMKAEMNPEGLLVLDDEKQFKTFEHSFLCSSNGINLEWASEFKIQVGIPAVLVESRLNNLTNEKVSCYQMWTTKSKINTYFSTSGENKISKGSVIPLRSSGGWVFFQVNEKGGIGMLIDKSLKGMMMFSFCGKNGKITWGVRSIYQKKSIFGKNQGTFLRFFLFYAKSPQDAKILCEKLKKMFRDKLDKI